MEFEHSEKVGKLQERVEAFMVEHIYPNEEELFAQVNEGDRWQPVPLLENLKAKARAAGIFTTTKKIFALADEEGTALAREIASLAGTSARSPEGARTRADGQPA